MDTAAVRRPEPVHWAEAARRLQALIDATVDAYYDWHIGEDIMDVSEQMDCLLGLPAHTLPRTLSAWEDRLHPEDRARVMAHLTAVVREGGRYEDEYRLRREDGSYVIVEDRACLLTDANDTPRHVVGTVRDVTENRMAMQSLREAQQRQELLFFNSPNPMFRLDPQGCFVVANAPGLQLIGLSEVELGGTSLTDFFQLDEEEGGRWASQDVFAALFPRSGEPVRTEVHVDSPQGPHHLLAAGVQCRVAGETALYLLCTDITRLKDLQDALQVSRQELTDKAAALTDANTALRVILDQREADRQALEKRVAANMQELVLPMVDRLRRSLGTRPEAVHVDVLWDTVCSVTESLGPLATSGLCAGAGLTRRETEVANLVRLGKTTPQIAEALNLDPATVSFHRGNIRRKLGLSGRQSRLGTFLNEQAEKARPAASFDAGGPAASVEGSSAGGSQAGAAGPAAISGVDSAAG